jgi:type III pantothenate kinase
MREMTLLLDNSNTRTKLLFSDDVKLGEEVLYLPTADLSRESLRSIIGGRAVSRVMVSSVVPAAVREIEAAFEVPVAFLTPIEELPMHFQYEDVTTLGADRVANALGCMKWSERACVAVDLGTAVTFDVIVPGETRPCFIGGSIAPGLAVMGQYLAEKTAKLPRISLENMAPAIGRSTVEAMQSGCLHGFCGMVREVLRGIETELGERPFVVATGGDAVLVNNKLGLFDVVDPLLTFRGLHLAAKYFF